MSLTLLPPLKLDLIEGFQQLPEHALRQPVVRRSIECDPPADVGGPGDGQESFLFGCHDVDGKVEEVAFGRMEEDTTVGGT
jgi:hypothetical protein